MPPYRWLALHDSRLISVHGSADRIRVELDGYIHQWEGSGVSRRGTRWRQRASIEIDFPDVDQGISTLPSTLSDGLVVSDALIGNGSGGMCLPLSVEGMVDLQLVATSGQRLKISGEGLRAEALGEARFVDEIAGELDPTRRVN